MMDPGDHPFDDPSRLSMQAGPLLPRPRSRPRPVRGELFLAGPVPWAWLAQASRQPGQALAVGLEVWFQAGLKKSDTVALSLSSLLAMMGVHRDAARRGLGALESAGLVRVERHAGRKPIVTILPFVA
jgi:hypothetical protein